jgi:hypothetical protein
MNQILICYCCSHVCELCHVSKLSIGYVVILSCILETIHQHQIGKRRKLDGQTLFNTPTLCSLQSRYYATTAILANIPEEFLGNGLVKTFPQQQTRMQQWYSNRGPVFSVVCSAVVAKQRRGKHISGATNPDTIEEVCFLCRPCRDVTTGRFTA